MKKERIANNSIVNVFIRSLSIIVGLAYTPFLLSVLGEEKYGLWITIMSIISWVNYFDVGIGNGLRNILAVDVANGEREHAQRAVSTAYILLSGIAFVFGVTLLLLCLKIDLCHLFSTSIDMRLPIIISVLFICVNFVLAIMNMALYALQMAVRVSLLNLFSQIIAFGLTVFLSICGFTGLSFLAFVYGFSGFAVYLINSLQLIKAYNYLRPRLSMFDKKCVMQICGNGMKFFVIQVMCLLMFTVDNLLITHFWGANELTPFSLVDKVYNTGYSFLAAFLVPLWSATTHALEANDKEWIKRSVRNAFVVWGCFCFGCVGVIFIFDKMMLLWIHRQLVYQSGSVVVVCFFYMLYGLLAVECQFINGTGKINVQLIMYIVLGLCNIPFSIVLGKYCGFGVVGVRMATLILVAIADIILGINMYHIFCFSCEKTRKNRWKGIKI